MTTDTSEKGLERLICTALTGARLRPADTGRHGALSGQSSLRRGMDLRRPAGL